jgi:hypothetical protein
MRNLLLEFFGELGVHQVYSATAEAAARHACTVRAVLLIGDLHHGVQFRTAHLVEVAQAFV